MVSSSFPILVVTVYSINKAIALNFTKNVACASVYLSPALRSTTKSISEELSFTDIS